MDNPRRYLSPLRPRGARGCVAAGRGRVVRQRRRRRRALAKWPARAGAALRVCPACHETLLQLYYEHLHWMREVRVYQEGG